MIDPKDILAASMAAHNMGQAASSAMAAPFMSGVSGMNVASSANASQVMNGVQGAGSKMWQKMTDVKNDIDKQVFSHQDSQRRQKTYDFKPDMSDLRPTDAQGFPKELQTDFFAPFLHK
jgi:iron uptake system EfeUOB component EfeO/EfeM